MACLFIGLIERALIFILNKDSHTSFLIECTIFEWMHRQLLNPIFERRKRHMPELLSRMNPLLGQISCLGLPWFARIDSYMDRNAP